MTLDDKISGMSLGSMTRALWTILLAVAVAILGLAIAAIYPRLERLAPGKDVISSRVLLHRQAVETWAELHAVIAPCDEAVAAVGDAAPPFPDQASPPEPAREAQARCRSASLRLLTLRAPKALDTASGGDLTRAMERCQAVYAVEGNAHARLAAALDAANGASVPDRHRLFDAWADVQEANIDALGCRTAMMAATQRAGVSSAVFGTVTADRPPPATGRII